MLNSSLRRVVVALAPLLLTVACAGIPGPVYTGPDAPPELAVAGFAPAEAGVALSGRPSVPALQAAAQAGYRTIVDLQTDAEGAADDALYAGAVGLRHVRIPIAGPKVTATAADQLAGVLSDPGAAPVLIHCKSGQRAAGLYALYLHRHRGLTIDAAVARGQELGLSKSEVIDAARGAAQ